jgi:(R,R)-butanediol dehydrogenase/meso-butanediol dehydrogenase/diacetyl reductase
MRSIEMEAERGHLRIVDKPVPVPDAGQIRIRVEYAGICGSDLHMSGGSGSEGDTLGHEFVGIVDELGEGVSGFEPGERITAVPALSCGSCVWCLKGEPVHCDAARIIGAPSGGAFADFAIVQAVSAVRVPAGVDARTAALIEPLSVGLRIVETAGLRAGDDLVIIGAGPIGVAATIWARQHGVARIIVSDPVESRRQLALSLGATHVVDPTAVELKDEVVAILGRRPGVVIEAAGRPGMLEYTVDMIAPQGTFVLAGAHNSGEVFHRIPALMKELTVKFPNFTSRTGFEHTVRILERGDFDPSVLVTHVVGLDGVDDVMRRLAAPNDFGKVLIDLSLETKE